MQNVQRVFLKFLLSLTVALQALYPLRPAYAEGRFAQVGSHIQQVSEQIQESLPSVQQIKDSLPDVPKFTLPKKIKRSQISCAVWLSAFLYFSPTAGPVTQAAIEHRAEQQLSESRAQVNQRAGSMQVSDLLGHPLAESNAEQLQNFKGQWAQLAADYEKVHLIPSKTSYINWWKLHETEILKLRKDLPTNMTMQQMFYWTANEYMQDTYSEAEYAKWLVENRAIAQQEIEEAKDNKETLWVLGFFAGLLGLIRQIAIGSLAAGPGSQFMSAAVEPGIRNPREKWVAFSERTWSKIKYAAAKISAFISLFIENDKRKPKGEDGDLTLAQMDKRHADVQKLRALMNSMSYTITNKAIQAKPEEWRKAWSEMYDIWKQIHTLPEREGRNFEWEATYFRPDHFTKNLVAARTGVEVFKQGFDDNVDRALRKIEPERQAKAEPLMRKFDAAIKKELDNEYKDAAKAKEGLAEQKQIREQLLELGVTEYLLERMHEQSSNYHLLRQNIVTTLFVNLKHLLAFPEFNDRLPETVFQEALAIRRLLGLDAFHRQFSSEVAAMGKELGYTLKTYEETIQAYKDLRKQ